jgi:hypothetical protein
MVETDFENLPPFNGTPEQFFDVVKDYLDTHNVDYGYPNLTGRLMEDKLGPNHKGFRIYHRETKGEPTAEYLVTAIIRPPLPSGAPLSTLRVKRQKGDWALLEATVSGLINYLWVQGWLGPKPIRASSETDQQKNERAREDQKIKTTAAHYGITVKKVLQKNATQLMGTTDKTYRKYKKKGWLLADREFKRITGKTPAEYWEEGGGN